MKVINESFFLPTDLPNDNNNKISKKSLNANKGLKRKREPFIESSKESVTTKLESDTNNDHKLIQLTNDKTQSNACNGKSFSLKTDQTNDKNNKILKKSFNVNKKRKKDLIIESSKESILSSKLESDTSIIQKVSKLKNDKIESNDCNESLESLAIGSHSPSRDSSRDSNTSANGDNMSESVHSNEKSKKKKARTTFTGRQIFELEKQFEVKKYLSSSERAEMAKLLNVTETQVSDYQNVFIANN